MWYETELDSETIKFAQEIRYDAFGRIESDNVLKTNLTTQGDAQQLLWKYYHYRDNPNYKTTGQIHSVSTVIGQGPDRFELIEYFEYDENGFIVRKEEVKSSGSTRTIEGIDYVYDEAGQLIRYNDQKNDRTWGYVYDAGGNIVTKNEYYYTTGTPGTLIKPYNYVYDSTWKDLLVSYDQKTITPDAIGNMVSFDGWNFTWEAGRQLAQMSKGADTLSFSYNDNGLRTRKTVNSDTTYYTWVGDKITREHSDDHSIYFRYDGDGSLIGFELEATQGSGQYFYIRNLQGDITGIVDASHNIVVEYSYDAWGKLLSTTGTLAT